MASTEPVDPGDRDDAAPSSERGSARSGRNSVATDSAASSGRRSRRPPAGPLRAARRSPGGVAAACDRDEPWRITFAATLRHAGPIHGQPRRRPSVRPALLSLRASSEQHPPSLAPACKRFVFLAGPAAAQSVPHRVKRRRVRYQIVASTSIGPLGQRLALCRELGEDLGDLVQSSSARWAPPRPLPRRCPPARDRTGSRSRSACGCRASSAECRCSFWRSLRTKTSTERSPWAIA